VKNVVMIAILTSMLSVAPANADTVRVKGHVTKNGVYVAPHVRTAPDSRKTNNWQSKPNVNPYTGEAGKVDPFQPSTIKPYKIRK
jgi:hypothetical protein